MAAKQQTGARKRSQSKRDKEQKAEPATGENGHEEEVARYAEELEGYLQERIKPGLNRGAIPLLARSIASDIAQQEYDLETDLRALQAELGDDWILYFSVQGDNTWLTAEKEDATQRVEAPSASVLSAVVKLLNDKGGRPTSARR
jgi:thymidylate kinase